MFQLYSTVAAQAKVQQTAPAIMLRSNILNSVRRRRVPHGATAYTPKLARVLSGLLSTVVAIKKIIADSIDKISIRNRIFTLCPTAIS